MKNGNIFPDEYIPDVEPSQIEKTVLCGQRYILEHRPKKTPLSRIFLDQIRYISPSLWVLQLIGLFVTGYCCAFLQDVCDSLMLLLTAIPLIAITNVPELVKDVLCDMSELERSSKIGGGVILTVRMTVVGVSDLTAIAIVTAITSFSMGSGFLPLLLFALSVYNIENAVCLAALRLFKIRERNSALLLSATILILTDVLCSSVTKQLHELLNGSLTPLIAVFIVSAALLSAQMAVFCKKLLIGGLTNEN